MMPLQMQESVATNKRNTNCIVVRFNMLKRKLLIPSILSLIYVLLCIMAFAFHIARHETDKFSAMFIAVLTLPWSFLNLYSMILLYPPYSILNSAIL